MLKKSLFIGTFFLLFIGLSDYGYGCHKENMTHGKNPGPCDPPDGGGGGDEGGSTLPVMVTFRDCNVGGMDGDVLPEECEPDDPDGFLPDRIQSDGFDAYIDRVDKVSTGIGSPNSFFMKLTKGNQKAIRTLFLDFSDCVSGEECNPPDPPQVVSVGPAFVFAGGVNLRAMALGDSGARWNLRLRVELNLFSEGQGLLSLFFDPGNMDCQNSTTIKVRRTALDTWVIEAGQDDVACLTGFDGSGDIPLGRYHMPFLMEVQTK